MNPSSKKNFSIVLTLLLVIQLIIPITQVQAENAGEKSEISRFLRNHGVDGFQRNELLKGTMQADVGYWQPNIENYSYKRTQEVFFNHNMATKYMQYFPIVKMTDDRVDLEQGVYVQREDKGKVHLYRDDQLLAIMTDDEGITASTVFIPWDPMTEEKVYHWNLAGGKTTWDVPKQWDDSTSAKLYELTDVGREFVRDVKVKDGKIELDVKEKTGYVLYQEEPKVREEVQWDEGGFVADQGFESRSFDHWDKSSTADKTDHIQMIRDDHWDGQLEITGPNDAKVEQEVTGLIPGKTYSASVWANIDGNRKVTIGVEQNGSLNTNWLDQTDHKYYGTQHKYEDRNFQRVKVNFNAKSDTAKLYVNVDEGNAKVLLDDVRIWENPSKTDDSDAILYEDFENVDEGWGPFVYSKSGFIRTSLAEFNEDKDQMTNFVIDGNFSLKTNEQGEGEWLRTLPQTMRLEPDKSYNLSLDVNAHVDDMYTIAVRVEDDGEVRDLASKTLKKGEQTVELDVDTEDAEDAYLAIIKNFDEGDESGTLIVDNILVEEEKTDSEIDVSDLEELIKYADGINNKDNKYTVDSYVNLQQVIKHAQEELESITTEEELSKAIQALQVGIDGLAINTSTLLDTVVAAKVYSNEDDQYTEESFENLQAAIKEAEETLETIHSEKELAEAIKALEESISRLEEKEEPNDPEPDIDVLELDDLITTAKIYSNKDDGYAEKSFAALEVAIIEAEQALTTIATEEELQNEIDNLQTAINGLQENKPSQQSAIDVTILEDLITIAKAYTNKGANYTKESFEALQAEITKAEESLQTIQAEEELVDASASLKEAIKGLTKVKHPEKVDDLKTESNKQESEESVIEGEDGNNKLPSTATSIYNWMLYGFILLGIGMFGILLIRKRAKN